MRSSLIARVFLCGQGSLKLVETTPGRHLKFVGGVAQITDARDMPYALKLAGTQVEVEPEYAASVPDWLSQIPLGQPSRARVLLLDAPEPEEPRVPESTSVKRGRPPKTLWEPTSA